MCEAVQLTVGTLVVGSLLWDPRRRAWRDARLDATLSDSVAAPIRYGRRSRRRGNTYTMVFSRLCELGQAQVIRYANTVSSPEDLITEAEHLWAAERIGPVERQISASWGCVALLPNPGRKIPNRLLSGWANRVAQENNYGNVPQTLEEGSLVSDDGLLHIAWPRVIPSNRAAQLDLLLVTATHPTLTGTPPAYPSIDAIADAWRLDQDDNVAYFWENRRHGIFTFQDDAIRKRLPNQT